MALSELARMMYAVNTMLEKASSSVGLSKRGALALAIMAVEEGSTLTNAELQQRFLAHSISTKASVAKDASFAKGELLKHGHISIADSVSTFAMTTKGRATVDQMYAAIRSAVDELGLSDSERRVLRELSGLPIRQPPASEVPAKTARRKRRESS